MYKTHNCINGKKYLLHQQYSKQLRENMVTGKFITVQQKPYKYSPLIGQNYSKDGLLLAYSPPSDPSHSEHMIYVLERVAHRTRKF